MYCSRKVIDFLKKLKNILSLEKSGKNRSLIGKILHNRVYRTLLGVVAGGIAGFLYWRFIGCNAGSCPITSNPYQSIIIFGTLGGFLSYDSKKKVDKTSQE